MTIRSHHSVQHLSARVQRIATVALAVLSATTFSDSVSAADPIALDRGNIFHFRSNSGPNNSGFSHLDGINTGIWVTPADGSSVTMSQVSSNGSLYDVSGTTTWGPFVLPRSNSPALPTEFSTLYEHGPAAASGLLGSWDIEVSNPGSANSPAHFATNSIAGVAAMPFVSNAAVSYAGGQITISWMNPATTISLIDFEIQDLSLPREYFGNSPNDYIGFSPIVHQESSKTPGAYTPLAPTTTSFTIPSVLSSGVSIDPTHKYVAAINLDLFETQTAGGITRDYLISRSKTFVNFSGVAPGGFDEPPAEIQIPTVTSNPDGSNTQFSFFIRELQPGMYFLDPDFATGYEYVTGAGDPNFASVLLPNVGDGKYRVEVFDAGSGQWVFLADVDAGQELQFGNGGVSRFRVLGIEASAQLDPGDPQAFATGITFAGGGAFTGKMIPIVAVPEPETWLLMGVGFALMALRRRRH